MQGLSLKYEFDIDMPFEELNEEAQQKILYGSGRQMIPFTYLGQRSLGCSCRYL